MTNGNGWIKAAKFWIWAIVLVVTFVSGYVLLQAQSNDNKEHCIKNEEDIEGLDEEVDSVQMDVRVTSNNVEHLVREVDEVQSKQDRLISMIQDLKK